MYRSNLYKSMMETKNKAIDRINSACEIIKCHSEQHAAVEVLNADTSELFAALGEHDAAAATLVQMFGTLIFTSNLSYEEREKWSQVLIAYDGIIHNADIADRIKDPVFEAITAWLHYVEKHRNDNLSHISVAPLRLPPLRQYALRLNKPA